MELSFEYFLIIKIDFLLNRQLNRDDRIVSFFYRYSPFTYVNIVFTIHVTIAKFFGIPHFSVKFPIYVNARVISFKKFK